MRCTAVRVLESVLSFWQLYTVVKNVKEAHECQEHGETQEFADDVEYLLSGIQEGEPMSTRCLRFVFILQFMDTNYSQYEPGCGCVSYGFMCQTVLYEKISGPETLWYFFHTELFEAYIHYISHCSLMYWPVWIENSQRLTIDLTFDYPIVVYIKQAVNCWYSQRTVA